MEFAGKIARRGVVLAVVLVLAGALGTATASAAPRAGAARSAQAAGRQGTPGQFLRRLVALTQRAVVRGRKILTSEEARNARKIANTARKMVKYYCDQWLVAYGQRTRGTASAVFVWRATAAFYQLSNAASAYSTCKRLAYLPILIYG